ncbi:unnamed protein product [Linum trigynum]|uniref:Uncharacterized protein n=1 Tax=Linum trigynum TaxID=586398 RepID=A0AAV2D5H5_9ROSI
MAMMMIMPPNTITKLAILLPSILCMLLQPASSESARTITAPTIATNDSNLIYHGQINISNRSGTLLPAVAGRRRQPRATSSSSNNNNVSVQTDCVEVGGSCTYENCLQLYPNGCDDAYYMNCDCDIDVCSCFVA